MAGAHALVLPTRHQRELGGGGHGGPHGLAEVEDALRRGDGKKERSCQLDPQLVKYLPHWWCFELGLWVIEDREIAN